MGNKFNELRWKIIRADNPLIIKPISNKNYLKALKKLIME